MTCNIWSRKSTFTQRKYLRDFSLESSFRGCLWAHMWVREGLEHRRVGGTAWWCSCLQTRNHCGYLFCIWHGVCRWAYCVEGKWGNQAHRRSKDQVSNWCQDHKLRPSCARTRGGHLCSLLKSKSLLSIKYFFRRKMYLWPW